MFTAKSVYPAHHKWRHEAVDRGVTYPTPSTAKLALNLDLPIIVKKIHVRNDYLKMISKYSANFVYKINANFAKF